mmetsp:Transcript_19339/g.60806  ORF Transcript_19339/g.60806 Transcript_19339/m.60806 type:complete len:344 (+) Transcript_19339:349-1380(+)
MEVGMLLDLLRPPRGGAQPQLRRAFQQALQQGDAAPATGEQIPREVQRCLPDLAKQLQLVLRVLPERQRANDELVHHHAQRPPIDGARVAFARRDDLWRHVLRRANQGARLQGLLAASEVHQLGVAAEIQQNVFRLQVSVHDPTRVQVLQGKDHGATVELRLRLRKAPDLADGIEELTPAKELRQEVDVLGVLKRLDELHDARVVALRIDLPLDADGALLPLLHNNLLAHALQRIDAALIILVVDQPHDAKIALAHDRLRPQVRHFHVQVLEVHTVLELVAETANDVAKHRLVEAEADACLVGKARRGAPLLQQKASLPEVVPTAEPSQLLAVLLDTDRSALD